MTMTMQASASHDPSTASSHSIYESYPSSPIDSPAPRVTGDPLPEPVYAIPERRNSTLKVRALSVRRKSPTSPYALTDHETHISAPNDTSLPPPAVPALADDRTPTGAPPPDVTPLATPVPANKDTTAWQQDTDASSQLIASSPDSNPATPTPHALHATPHENTATSATKPSTSDPKPSDLADPTPSPALPTPPPGSAPRSSPKEKEKEEPTLTDKPSSVLPIPRAGDTKEKEKRRMSRVRGPCGVQCVVQ